MGKQGLRWFLGLLFVAAIIAIRLYEDHLWYDPLNGFFAEGSTQLPDLSSIHFHGTVVVRFLLNAVFSIGFIHVLFVNREYTKLAAWIQLITFAVCLVLLEIFITLEQPPIRSLFWVRRVLTYPLLLFVLLAFFYRQHLLVRHP